MQFITDYTLRNWDKMQPQDLLECASVINESARNISDHLGNLLSWARMQNSDFSPQPASFGVAKALEEELKVQQPFVRIKQLHLHTALDQELTLFSDLNFLKLILHNLVTNAIKFTNKGGSINIGLEAHQDGILLRISDTGIGISEEEIKSLTNKKTFTKLGTVNEQGSGFGMIITHKLIDMLNGTLSISSEENQGTTFSVYLPNLPH